MNSVQLELEKIIEYLEGKQNECEDHGEVYEGLAYKDAKEKCERLLEAVTGVYPESRLEDIQE